MLPINLFDPIINGVKHVTYHRNPTQAEIKFGYGATHYRDFPKQEVMKRQVGPLIVLKKWFVADDGLRYYR